MANRIKDLRELHKMKQIDLAILLNVSQGTLSNWERGVHDLDNETLIAIAERFNVSSDYVLGRTDNPTSPNAKEKAPSALQGLNPEADRAYFSIMKAAKDKGFSPNDIQAAMDLLEYARKRDKEDK